MTTIAPPPTRLNEEPTVLWGATAPELIRLTVGSFIGWLIPVLMILAPLDLWVGVVALVPMLTFGTVWVATLYMRARRRGKPASVFAQDLVLWKQRYGFLPPTVITRSGYWSTGRTR